MKKYILRRMLLLLPTVFGVVTVVFFLIHLLPGDPVELMLGEQALYADKEALKEALGLNKPLYRQYISFLSGVSKGDFGTSIHTGEPVASTILRRYPATLQLTLAAALAAVIISIPLGVISASKKGTLYDRGSMLFALIGVSMPNFWFGPLLILLFSITFDIFPVSGYGSMMHLVLPALTLGLGMSGILTRITRASVLESLSNDYVRTAKAKGLTNKRILYLHALKNALIPVLTILGLQFGALLAGSIVTETIFSWPGVGRLIIQAINSRDYPVVQGAVFAIAISYVLINLITDILYFAADPRIRLER